MGGDANLASEGDAPVVYVMQEWMDESSVLAVSKGLIVVDLRTFLLSADGPTLSTCVATDRSLKMSAQSHLKASTMLGLESKVGISIWRHLRPLTLRDWGFVRT